MLSVLTDTQFFGGSIADLLRAREKSIFPILRKDFIIDEYQVIESKSIGADAILLIAAILEEKTIARLARSARSLGLEVILDRAGSRSRAEVAGKPVRLDAAQQKPEAVGKGSGDDGHSLLRETVLDEADEAVDVGEREFAKCLDVGIRAEEAVGDLRQVVSVAGRGDEPGRDPVAQLGEEAPVARDPDVPKSAVPSVSARSAESEPRNCSRLSGEASTASRIVPTEDREP